MQVGFIVFLEGQGLQLTISNVGNGEVLEDTRVRVSKVAVLYVELGATVCNQLPGFLGHISRSIGCTKDYELGGMGLEVLSLRDGDGSQDTVVGVDDMEELGDIGERVSEVSIGSSEVLV